MKSVADKQVLITGAARGMGKRFAERAVAEGAAMVVLWDIDEPTLQATADELAAAGGNVQPYVVDVSNPADIAAAAALVREDVGRIDVLINNAGIVRGNDYFWADGGEPAAIAATMAINSLAPMYLTREFLPGMIAASTPCRIVTIASAAGLVANPRMAVYAASKWAAIGWSDSVRLELEQAGHDHVRMTTVCPTYIDTGMFEGAQGILLTPMLKPEQVVEDTWHEMLKGGPFLITPWTTRLNKVLSGILPVSWRDKILEKAGVYHSMDEFTGHDK